MKKLLIYWKTIISANTINIVNASMNECFNARIKKAESINSRIPTGL